MILHGLGILISSLHCNISLSFCSFWFNGGKREGANKKGSVLENESEHWSLEGVVLGVLLGNNGEGIEAMRNGERGLKIPRILVCNLCMALLN